MTNNVTVNRFPAQPHDVIGNVLGEEVADQVPVHYLPGQPERDIDAGDSAESSPRGRASPNDPRPVAARGTATSRARGSARS
jgi:hypothetical protein